jgi:hypothetical protein
VRTTVVRDAVSGAPGRRWRLLPWGVAFVVYLYVAVVHDPRAAFAALLSDDAFYYFKIARSIVAGDGSTFDGIAPTNGYHPLWMLVSVAVFAMTGGDPELPIRILVAISITVAFGTIVQVHGLVDREVAPGLGWLAAGLCLLPTTWTALTNGMETGILLLSLVVFVRVSLRFGVLDPETPFGPSLALGALLGVVFLCRLDAVFVIVAVGVAQVGVCIVRRMAVRSLVRRGAALSIGVAVVAAPFAIWNHVHFGHLMPISGAVKSTFPVLRSVLDLHTDMAVGLVIVLAAVACFLVTAVSDRRRGRGIDEILASPYHILVVAAVLHFVYLFLFMDWGVFWWHFAASSLAFVFTGAMAVDHVLAAAASVRVRRLSAAAVAAALIVAGSAWHWSIVRSRGQIHAEWLRAAHWVRANTAPDAIVALKDAGLFGYFSERRVVNLDGKANGYAYLEALRRGDVLRYLVGVGVDYLAEINCRYIDDRAGIVLIRPRQANLWLSVPQELEVYRGTPTPGRSQVQPSDSDTNRFAIWRFDPVAVHSRE